MKRIFFLLLLLGLFFSLVPDAYTYDDWDVKKEAIIIEDDVEADDRTVEEIIDELTDEKSRVRSDAMDECKRRGPEILDKIKELLKHEDFRTRRCILELYMHFKPKNLFELLKKFYFEDENRAVRETCLEGLLAFPNEAGPIFIDQVISEKEELKKDAYYYLGKSGPRIGLAGAKAYYGNNEKLYKALHELGRIQCKQLLGAFTNTFYSKKGYSWLVKRGTPEAIQKFFIDPVLGFIGEGSVTVLIDYFENPDPALTDGDLKMLAIFFNFARKDDMITCLQENITSDVTKLQVASIAGLTFCKYREDPGRSEWIKQNQKFLPDVQKGLKDDDYEVVEEAVFGLASLGQSLAGEYNKLAEIYKKEEGDPKNIAVIGRVIGRQGYARQEGKPTPNDKMTFLLEKFDHKDVNFRKNLAYGLGNYPGKKEAAIALEKYLKDKSQPMEVQIASAYSIGRLRMDIGVDALIAKLSTDNADLLCASIESLGFIGNPKAHNEVLPFLKHKNPKVIRSAMVALCVSTPSRAIDPTLVRYFQYPSFEWEGYYGLAEKNDMYHILPFLKGDDQTLRMQAMFTAYALARKHKVFFGIEQFPSAEAVQAQKEENFKMFSDWWEEEKDAVNDPDKIYNIKKKEYDGK